MVLPLLINPINYQKVKGIKLLRGVVIVGERGSKRAAELPN